MAISEEEMIKIFGIFSTAYPKFDESLKDNQKLDNMIELWILLFQDCSFDEMKLACIKYTAEGKFAPTIADIREKIAEIRQPEVFNKTGDEIWGEILSAIGKYGSYREQEALESMSETARMIATRMGYKQLCMSETQMVDRAHCLKIFENINSLKKQKSTLPYGLQRDIEMFGYTRRSLLEEAHSEENEEEEEDIDEHDN